jgi:succinate dehydrogenase flavin-adding protein (antitoxin of CptAB toxin-antitoxin module)
LTHEFIVPGLYFGHHRQKHDFRGMKTSDLEIGAFLNSLAQMRRNELRDLNLIVEQRRHSLFRLAHDAKHNLVRRLRILLHHGMIRVLADDQTLTRN